MEGHKSECMKLKQIITNNNEEINGLMDSIGPGVPLSDSIMGFITGVKDFFDDNVDNLPSDDEEEIDESNIVEVLNKVVNKDNLRVDENDENDDNLSEMSEKDMYHLKILKDESDNEDSGEDNEKDNEKEEQNDGDNISFF